MDAFIAKHDLSEMKVPATDGKGEKKSLHIKDAIKLNTNTAGARQNIDIGRSAQTSTANRMVELVNQYCSNEVQESMACVNSEFLGDGQKTAYGRPIKIGNGKVELEKFPEYIKAGTHIAEKINNSRKSIGTEQSVYTTADEAVKIILPLLKGRCDIAQINGAITIEARRIGIDDENIPFDKRRGFKENELSQFQALKASLSRLLQLEFMEKLGSDESSATDPRVIEAKIEPRSIGALEALAEELGTKVIRPVLSR